MPNSEKHLTVSTDEVEEPAQHAEPREIESQGVECITNCTSCVNGTIEFGRCSSCDAPELIKERYSTAEAGAKAG